MHKTTAAMICGLMHLTFAEVVKTTVCLSCQLKFLYGLSNQSKNWQSSPTTLFLPFPSRPVQRLVQKFERSFRQTRKKPEKWPNGLRYRIPSKKKSVACSSKVHNLYLGRGSWDSPGDLGTIHVYGKYWPLFAWASILMSRKIDFYTIGPFEFASVFSK